MNLTIVIPTYNEKENIELLIRKILELSNDFQIIVVDDNSPDGTGEILDKLAQKTPQLKIIHRPKKLGIGSAYIEGFKFALKEKPDFIFQMDGDLSHDPKYLFSMLAEIKNCGLVIGSRYIKGGGIRYGNLIRRLLSRIANFYAKIMTEIPISDTTSGYKCFRREVLEKINLDNISSQGYAFQIEMNYLTWKRGFCIKEIPIIFYERSQGKSKMSFKIIWEAFLLVWKLHFNKLP